MISKKIGRRKFIKGASSAILGLAAVPFWDVNLWRKDAVTRSKLIVIPMLVVLFVSQNVYSETTTMESLFPKNWGDEWTLREAPEKFTKDTLFEHIDGQADLFLQYGFETSTSAIYRKVNSSDDKIDMDIYDMGNSLQAFGVFSRFRQEEKPAGIGLDSYLDDRYAIFYKGKYFVVLQATDSIPSTLRQLAQEIASGIVDNSAPPKEIGYFPKTGLKPGSIEYYPNGLLGHEYLKRGFKASYVKKDQTKTDGKTASDDREFNLFFSIFDNSEDALNAIRLYSEHLSNKGKLTEKVPTQLGPDTLIGMDPYQGKTIVAHKGHYVLGAVGFEQDSEGEQRLAELMKEVK